MTVTNDQTAAATPTVQQIQTDRITQVILNIYCKTNFWQKHYSSLQRNIGLHTQQRNI